MTETDFDSRAALPPCPGSDRPRQRLLYDLSFTCASGKTSGIERVVRSWLRVGADMCPASGDSWAWEFVPVFCWQGRFYRWNLQARQVFQPVADMERDCVAQLPAAYRQFATRLCQLWSAPQLRRGLLPPSGHLGVFKSWHRRRKRSAGGLAIRGQQPIDLTADDILWLPDAYWARPEVWTAASSARQQGALVAALVYDLIPLRNGNQHPAFAHYLEQLLSICQVVQCISDCERQRLIEFRNRHPQRGSMCGSFSTVTLGCEWQPGRGEVRGELKAMFSGHDTQPVFLCVNTFDPRKNHRYLLDAFDQLWQRGSQVRLCLVGRVGWQCGDIVQRIAAHPQLGHRLFVFHDASDVEVDYCYQQARAVITASLDEGFGLPIVESLARGKTTLASDIASHREVGGNACWYFDPHRVEQLQALVGGLATDGGPTALPRKPRLQHPPKLKTWAESFQECWQQLRDAHRRQAHSSARQAA